MRCIKHNYEYGYGRCPHCEQDTHNREAQRLSREHTTAMIGASEAQRVEIQRLRQEAELREQALIDRENEKRIIEQQSKAKKEILNFIPKVAELYGSDFFARFYLRFITYSSELIGSNSVEEIINEHFASSMSDTGKKIYLLQNSLLENVVKQRTALELTIESKIESAVQISSNRNKIKTLTTIFTIAFMLWVIEFSSIVNFIFACIISYAIGVGFIMFSAYFSNLSLIELEGKERSKLIVFNESFKWLLSEISESKKLYDNLLSSEKLAILILEKWKLEHAKGLTQSIQNEIKEINKVITRLAAN